MIDTEKFKLYSPKLYNIGQALADKYRAWLVQTKAVASGTLKNFKWNIKSDQNGLKLVFYLPSYWRYIEFGRRKTVNGGDGSVRRKIREWIDIKGIQPKKKGDYTPTRDELADMITRSIHRRGYKPRKPLQSAISENKSLEQEFVNTAAKIFTGDIKEMLLELNTTKGK